MKFSVSMSVYGKDNPEHFKLAVESILNQTVAPDEIVLVVDGPVPDELGKEIKTFEKREDFNVIYLEKNVGHGEARRKGFENCKNELIALMDADDISVDTRFEKQLKKFAEDDSLDIVGGNIIEFAGTPDCQSGSRVVPSDDAGIKEYMKKRCPMNQVTVMFKRKAVEAAGGYIDWFCEEDYYLWIRMYLNGAVFANIDDVLVFVRTDEGMYSRRGGWKYFKSEALLQKYMLNKKIIGFVRFAVNVTQRLILQVLMPDKIREFIFKKFARE